MPDQQSDPLESAGSGRSAPPPTARSALPPPPRGFTGRRDVLRALAGALNPVSGSDTGGSVVSVAGLPGAGKTALAVVAAHEALWRGWFAGVLFVDLRGHAPGEIPLTAGQALDELLRALGAEDGELPCGVAEKAALYRARLAEAARERGGPLLVVADDPGDAEQVEPLLPGDGGHRLLVASRRRLVLDGARHVGLGALPGDDAVGMLRALLDGDARADDVDGLRRIAEACGCLPLALRICADLLTGPGRPSLESLAERLAEDASGCLEQGDGRPSVPAAFDPSLRRLTPAQARMFVLLGLAPGPDLSTEAAAVLAGTDPGEAVEVLDALAAAHLVTAHPETGRWGMHVLLADYARHRARAEADEDSTRSGEQWTAVGRLLSHYTVMAKAADDQLLTIYGDTPPDTVFSGRKEALAWLDTERATLVAAVRTAVAIGHAPASVDLPFHMSRYLSLRGAYEDVITLAAIAHDAAEAAGYPQDQALAWHTLGMALWEAGRYEEAVEAHTRACGLFQQIANYREEAVAWHGLGMAFRNAERYEEAVDAHVRARDLYRQADDSGGEATLCDNLAATLEIAGRLEEAVEAHVRARDLYRQAGDRRNEALAWYRLGDLSHRVGRHGEAADAFAQACDLFRQVGEEHGEASAWLKLGAVFQDLGRLEEAVEAHTRAGTLFPRVGDRLGEASAWHNLGTLFQEAGRYGEAADAWGRVRDLYRKLDDHSGEAEAWHHLGLAFREAGRLLEAVDALDNAVRLSIETGDSDRCSSLFEALGELRRELENGD